MGDFEAKKFSEHYLPVCVLMCLLSKLGLSKAFPQTSHGSIALSPLDDRILGPDLGNNMAASSRSPVLLATDEVCDSPDTDLCSSSPLDCGDFGKSARERSESDKSRGDSEKNMENS